MKYRVALIFFTFTFTATNAWAHEWQPVTGEENIKALFSDTIMTRTLKDDVTAKATYNADGTGMLEAWGDRFPRLWEVRSDTEACIQINTEFRCFTLEVDASNPSLYRATVVGTGESVEFGVTDQEIKITGKPDTGKGGAAQPSAEEIAAKLANPNTPLATLTFRLQYRDFGGSLPNADGQGGTTLLAQPSFPFSLSNGDAILFRPAIPLHMGKPTFDSSSGNFETKFGLGDIVFDIAYAKTTKTGWLLAGGIVSSLPTATSDGLGSDNWTLGPEVMVGKLTKKYVIGVFPSYQSDIAGSGADTSLTTVQAFYTYLPGGGWNLGTTPIMTFDHNSDQWTIPINFTLGKTIIWNGRPWKLSAEINYYVEQPDAFGPDWFIGFNVGPVVENVLARWFK
jgi:hypothetical protein